MLHAVGTGTSPNVASYFYVCSLKIFVIFFISLPVYMKVVHLVSGVVDQCFSYVCVGWGVLCLAFCYVQCHIVMFTSFALLCFSCYPVYVQLY
jgi:hypothetical protein